MAKPRRIRAELQSAGRGGHVVAVGDDVAASVGLKQHSRVRGTINGTPYRSSIARYGGVTYLGVHKATVEKGGLAIGDSVEVTIELDTEPRELDIPAELQRAVEANAKAKTAWTPCRRATSASMRRPSLTRKSRRPGSAGSRRRSMRCSGARSGLGSVDERLLPTMEDVVDYRDSSRIQWNRMYVERCPASASTMFGEGRSDRLRDGRLG